MGDLTRGITFSGSPATATTTDVHNLVDDATINNLAVTTAKLANNAVDSSKLADDTITNAKLLLYVPTVTGTDALVLTPGGTYSAYAEGDIFYFKAVADNTGAAMSVNIAGLGVKTLNTQIGTTPAAGAVRNGGLYAIQYDGTNFTLLADSLPDRVWSAASASGTDTVALTYSGFAGPKANNTGMLVAWKAGGTNTGAMTLNVNGLGAVSIKKNLDEDMAAGDIQSGQDVLAMFDGTNYQIVSNLDLARCASATFDRAADSILFKDATDSNVKQGTITLPVVETATATGSIPADLNKTTIAHGITGGTPQQVRVVLRCTTADLNWSVGDELDIAGFTDGGGNYGLVVTVDATNVVVYRYASAIRTLSLSAGNPNNVADIDTADWEIKVYATHFS